MEDQVDIDESRVFQRDQQVGALRVEGRFKMRSTTIATVAVFLFLGVSACSSSDGDSTDSDSSDVDTDTDVDTEEDPNLIIYDAGCNEVANYGWRWADEALRGASWNEVKEETNTDNCRTIKLCPRACEKLQVHNGEREWQSVAASFGCAPVVAIE